MPRETPCPRIGCMHTDTTADFDVVIVGGGHNALTAAAYLARGGCSVLLLERLDDVGGAAVSAAAFAGHDARLSRYSYLVSLLPQQVIDDLDLEITLARRRYASYTPVPGDPTGLGLLIDNNDDAATDAAFTSIGASEDAVAFRALNAELLELAQRVWPTVTEPLPTRSELRERLSNDALWEAVFERPLGELIEQRFASDLVRGVVATDALISTFAQLRDEDLQQNRCFLYHVIGGGTGDWDVPIGGMGEVSRQLAAAALAAGATISTGATVTSVTPDGAVSYTADGQARTVSGRFILSGVAPAVLDELLGKPAAASDRPEGAQVKVNLLLKRLPKLKDETVDPAAAFGGTFHINEQYSQLHAAYEQAAAGSVPSPLPCEIYCHSLTDPSILSPALQAQGAQTLTVFALHVPDRLLTEQNNDAMRVELQQAVLDSLNSVFAEPIEALLLTDAAGNPCIETKTTRDIEDALAMPGGNIFHGPLSWPFAEDDAAKSTPAERWGVATEHERVLLCGSGAVRGGCVSGIGGHNAAQAVFESIRST